MPSVCIGCVCVCVCKCAIVSVVTVSFVVLIMIFLCEWVSAKWLLEFACMCCRLHQDAKAAHAAEHLKTRNRREVLSAHREKGAVLMRRVKAVLKGSDENVLFEVRGRSCRSVFVLLVALSFVSINIHMHSSDFVLCVMHTHTHTHTHTTHTHMHIHTYTYTRQFFELKTAFKSWCERAEALTRTDAMPQ